MANFCEKSVEYLVSKIIDEGEKENLLKNKPKHKPKPEIKPIIRGDCRYCGVELNETNVKIARGKYMVSGRVCNNCRRGLHRFYVAKPLLVGLMRRLEISEDKIKKILEIEKMRYIRKNSS
jgi:hypothetical protein